MARAARGLQRPQRHQRDLADLNASLAFCISIPISLITIIIISIIISSSSSSSISMSISVSMIMIIMVICIYIYIYIYIHTYTCYIAIIDLEVVRDDRVAGAVADAEADVQDVGLVEGALVVAVGAWLP